MECGSKLFLKELEHEGMIPYCSKCNEYRFPMFNVAVSVIILSYDLTKTLLIKQYNKDFYRLVAGYVNKGEAAEEALVREMEEEIGVKPIYYKLLKTSYFAKSNTLMVNFYAVVNTCDIKPNYEIDSYNWFSIRDAISALEDAKLAYSFYNNFILKELSMELKFYKQNDQIIYSFENQDLEVVKANSVDAAKEKHVPVVEINGNDVNVCVGSVLHPMQDVHYITFILVQTNKGVYKKDLKPGEEPKASFKLAADEKFVAAYEYCNLHGLWVFKA